MRYIKTIILEILALLAFCALFILFIKFSEMPISRWLGYLWITIWIILGLSALLSVLLTHGKDILETLSSNWTLTLVVFFGWGFVWYFVCKYIEKKTGFSNETTFFLTFMPSFSVFGYLVGKFSDRLRRSKIDN